MDRIGGCPSCGVENVAEARFCMACGEPLVLRCHRCETQSPWHASFCISCGANLTLEGEQRSPREARRTVSVLFADLVGYTSLSERLDHEAVKALTDRCLTRLAVEVEHFGGYVNRYMGDNIMAIFGAPVAHEDDAERAVRAACAMQAAMAELNSTVAAEFGVELALRIGVNTGDVLAGMVGGEYTVVGDAVNVAARLQGAAPVSGILVGERTRRACASAAVFQERGPLSLKGKADPVEAWEVVESRVLGRPEYAQAAPTAFVGRHVELAQLNALLQGVRDSGEAHLVTLIGEAGVGKTRLFEEFELASAHAAGPLRVRRTSCPGFGTAMAFWPLAETLRAGCGAHIGDQVPEVRRKLARWLTQILAVNDEVERRLEPLARVLGVDTDQRQTASWERNERSERERVFGAARAVFEAIAGSRGLILVWEDIHWADEGTLDLIEYLARWLRAPVLQVCTSREELLDRRPSWGGLQRGSSRVFLKPLGPAESRLLIAALSRRLDASIATPDELAERCGGNPFFAEALVERVAAAGEHAQEELPETVQGVITARLDSIQPSERQLLSHAAVVGRSFPRAALEELAQRAGIDLDLDLASLCERNLIAPPESLEHGGEPRFAFKHVLIRDVAYEMLPMAVRARKHAEVATFIEDRSSKRIDAVSPLLAEHFGRAATLAAEAHLPAHELRRLRGRAFEATEAAGDAATHLYANQEALDQFRAATSFADPGDSRLLRIAEKQGDVELRLGRPRAAIDSWQRCLLYHSQQGHAHTAAELHRKIATALMQTGERKAAVTRLGRGIDLIIDTPPSPELVRLFEQAALLYVQGGENIHAVYASTNALRLAEKLGEPRLAARTHGVLGRVFGRVGDVARARDNLQRAVELARGSGENETALALLAMGHNLQDSEGDYTGAEARFREALQLAERVGDVPLQIELRAALGRVAFHRCDWQEATLATEVGSRLAEREGLITRLCLPNTLRGQLCWRLAEWSTSESLLEHARKTAQSCGWFEVSIDALMGLAATRRDSGALDGAELALAQAFEICEQAGAVAQTIRLHSALAVTRALGGAPASAREPATKALELAERVTDPVDRAFALEAQGAGWEYAEALAPLAEAGQMWTRLGRPLDRARCEMVLGRRLSEQDPQRGSETLLRAAVMFEQIGVGHLAARSRALAGA